MKKIIAVVSVALIVLSACSTSEEKDTKEATKSDSEKAQAKTEKDTKSSNSNTINEKELEEFVRSMYQADKQEDVEHADSLLTDDVQTIVYRQFQSASQEDNKNYQKSTSNPKLYKGVDDEDTYLATLEVKVKNNKTKDTSWKQKTMQLKTKDNKVSEIEQVGERDIFDKQD